MPGGERKRGSDDIEGKPASTQLALLNQAVRNLDSDVGEARGDIDKINEKLDSKFVTQEQLKPIQYIVYGFVTTCLMAVLWTLLSLIGLRGK